MAKHKRVTPKLAPEQLKLMSSASKTISGNPTKANKKIGGKMFIEARIMQITMTEIDVDVETRIKQVESREGAKSTRRSTPAGEAKTKFALKRLQLRGLAQLHGQRAAPKGGFSSPITSSQGGGKGGGLFLHPRFGPKKTL